MAILTFTIKLEVRDDIDSTSLSELAADYINQIEEETDIIAAANDDIITYLVDDNYVVGGE